MIKEKKVFINYELGDRVVLTNVDNCCKWRGQRQYLGGAMTIASKVTHAEASSTCGMKLINRVDFTFCEDEEKYTWSYDDIDHEKTKELNKVVECERVKKEVQLGYEIGDLVEGVVYRNGIFLYKIKDGQLYSKLNNRNDDHFSLCSLMYNSVTSLRFTEVEFCPKYGETYYFPSFSRSGGYDEEVWSDDGFDMRVKSNIGIFRTIKQAQMISLTNGWIDEHELIEEEI